MRGLKQSWISLRDQVPLSPTTSLRIGVLNPLSEHPLTNQQTLTFSLAFSDVFIQTCTTLENTY